MTRGTTTNAERVFPCPEISHTVDRGPGTGGGGHRGGDRWLRHVSAWNEGLSGLERRASQLGVGQLAPWLGGRWRRLFHDDDDAAQRSAFELPDDDGGPGSDAHLFDDDNHSGPRCAKWSLGNRGWNLDTRGEFPMVLGHR